MIVLNFIFVLAFAGAAEYLRTYVFPISKIVNWKRQRAPAKKETEDEK